MKLEKALVWRKSPPGDCNASAMLIARPPARRPPARQCSRWPGRAGGQYVLLLSFVSLFFAT